MLVKLESDSVLGLCDVPVRSPVRLEELALIGGCWAIQGDTLQTERTRVGLSSTSTNKVGPGKSLKCPSYASA